jgi:imidazoleglycerol-phosphate dehydratase
MKKRQAAVHRKTKETDIRLKLTLDGRGRSRVKTGIAFLDHMLESLARHGRLDLELAVKGDLHVDTHHTNEDVGIALGQALKTALGDKKGIRRFGDFRAPLDEALSGAQVSLDFSGRGSFHLHTRPATKWIDHPALRAQPNTMRYTIADMKHFLESFAAHAGMTLHLEVVSGEQPHHVIEASFKALAKALDTAVSFDPRVKDVPSTKGKL